MRSVGALVETVPITTGENEFLSGKGGEFLLESRRAKVGKASKVAQVDLLISALEKQAEDFRTGLWKEIR